ncbi:MAG: VWA domain-containing protein [Candidatus Methanoplasma sp.]|jgi:magnesium chelatase subunit D|nr:VWA domain-containing protein [Candidatus Methanoplasma sp.]
MPSGPLSRRFPFSAIKGMEDVKKALMCAVADDDILGVLIKGPTGTAKSVMVRSFIGTLPGKSIVNIPQNVTDEQLFGGLDIEDAIRFGKTAVKGGILQRADGNILYIDNINLFDPKTLSSILECAESGKVIVEREGISAEYELRTTVIATMDPAEQMLPDDIADRFDICVQSYSADDIGDRIEIITSNLEFEADPEGFAERYSKEDSAVLLTVDNARNILKDVEITRSDIEKISRVCLDLNVKGHRADISTARTSKVLAALDGRTAVSDADIKAAAILCLLHRRKDAAKERNVFQPQRDESPPEGRERETTISVGAEERETDEGAAEHPEHTQDELSGGSGTGEDLGTVAEIISSVKEKLEDMDSIEAVRLHKIAGKTGKRKNITVKKRAGRHRGFKMPEGRSTDPAFDATVRAAAPYQRIREKKDLSINIEQQDIREKIRIRRDSCSFLFAVDVSGSLVKSGMMQDIKNGVKAMLMDNYIQRDKVALLTFRTGEVRISVPFTRSIEGICDILENTMTGDGTPLGPALLLIRGYMINYVRKNPEERCCVILITDGEATYPVIRGKDATLELRKVTAVMKIPNTEWIVVDSSLVPGRVNHALNLSRMLGGRYIRLEDLQFV